LVADTAESTSPASGRLARSLVTLAGTPDDASEIRGRLVGIAQLAADDLVAVSYASTTQLQDCAYTTVAATSELATAVDQAQYAGGNGPCLDALETGQLVEVPNLATTMEWPDFRTVAFGLGLRASLSIPLFAGSGAPVASMNLYGHDGLAMAALTARVRAVYRSDQETLTTLAQIPPDPRADDLCVGLKGALAVRGRIQRAIGFLMERRSCSADDAYLHLRVHAADAGMPLSDVAKRTLEPPR
jgi:hypothetical protein